MHPDKNLLDLTKPFCYIKQDLWLNQLKYFFDSIKSYQNEPSLVARNKCFS